MFSFPFIRPYFARPVAIALMAAPLLCGITPARAGDASLTAARPAGHRALREFDRFLDHHPLLEAQMRLDPALIGDQVYLKKAAELRDFLSANPEVVQGLKNQPRYFLYRALLRQARAPLRYSEIAQFREVLDAQPELERALVQNPEAIRDPAFLAGHALLRDFLARHPALALEFLPLSQSPDGNPSHFYPPTSLRSDSPVQRSRQRQ